MTPKAAYQYGATGGLGLRPCAWCHGGGRNDGRLISPVCRQLPPTSRNTLQGPVVGPQTRVYVPGYQGRLPSPKTNVRSSHGSGK
jgi:hypothetical protein